MNSVRPDTKRKIKTFQIWEPVQDKKILKILNTFEIHQEELKQEIKNSENVLESVISAPANKNIVYTIEKAFEILITHEKRHLQQANRMKAAILNR